MGTIVSAGRHTRGRTRAGEGGQVMMLQGNVCVCVRAHVSGLGRLPQGSYPCRPLLSCNLAEDAHLVLQLKCHDKLLAKLLLMPFGVGKNFGKKDGDKARHNACDHDCGARRWIGGWWGSWWW